MFHLDPSRGGVLCSGEQAPDGAENLVKMHEELQTKRAVTEQLSRDLEDPANLIRYRNTRPIAEKRPRNTSSVFPILKRLA